MPSTIGSRFGTSYFWADDGLSFFGLGFDLVAVIKALEMPLMSDWYDMSETWEVVSETVPRDLAPTLRALSFNAYLLRALASISTGTSGSSAGSTSG